MLQNCFLKSGIKPVIVLAVCFLLVGGFQSNSASELFDANKHSWFTNLQINYIYLAFSLESRKLESYFIPFLFQKFIL